MPFANHIRVTAFGTLGSPSTPTEEWSCTLNCLLATGNTVGQPMADSAHAAWAALITDSAMKFAAATTLRHVKVAAVDTTGHIPGQVFTSIAEPASGGTQSPLHPFQCSLAVSLRTGERGPSKRGRIFLPPQALDINGNTGEINGGIRDGMQAPLITFFNALQTSVGLVQIASSKGYNTQVTGFNIGLVMDTQRRRRRSLPESYELPVPL